MARDADINNPKLRGEAVNAARGIRPFDVLIENVEVLDMVSGRGRQADIGLVGPLIASVHEPNQALEAKQRIDGEGGFALPGFIDTHMHIESSMITPAEYAKAVVPRGVTTAVWDPHELANACGIAGVDYARKAAEDATMRILTLAPTCVPSAPGFEFSGGDFGPDIIAQLLDEPDIHGAAELMTMQPLISNDPRVRAIVDAGLASGKRVCGHARGLEGRDLAAYAVAGVETDHELTSAADLLAKLETGLTIELRGSHAHLLPEFVEAICTLGHLPQTVTLCTDDVFPDDLYRQGGLDHVIRMLIENGLPPSWAFRAATLNAATRIGRKDLGLVAPGKRADIVLLSELDEVRVSTVLMDGQIVAEGGAVVASPATASVSETMLDTVHTPDIQPGVFEIHATGQRARIATLSKPRFPEWGERTVDIRDGKLVLPDDMVRMAVINRYGRNTPVRNAFLENWGEWRGAFASTVSHDSHNLTVFGRDPADMAAAVKAVLENQGGLAVAEGGRVVALLSLPVAGLLSEDALSEVAAGFTAVRNAVDGIVEWQPPYLVFKALFGASLVCNAGPRLSDAGLVDVFNDHIQESCVLSEE